MCGLYAVAYPTPASKPYIPCEKELKVIASRNAASIVLFIPLLMIYILAMRKTYLQRKIAGVQFTIGAIIGAGRVGSIARLSDTVCHKTKIFGHRKPPCFAHVQVFFQAKTHPE